MSVESGDSRTLADLARAALQVQDACNLSGVVRSFGRDIRRLRELLEGEGRASTDAINRHPICVLWSSKIGHLTGSEGLSPFRVAYEGCLELAAAGVRKESAHV